jgi:alkyl sulfatase BDS1-like metallo-beta-lactamase superfamily hydrolase
MKMERYKNYFLALFICVGMVFPTHLKAEDKPKPASEATRTANAAVLQELPFDNTKDFEDAQKGFIAFLPDKGIVKNDQGEVIYDADSFAIPLDAKSPETVNPSFWRISQLNGLSGLFKVVDRIYQVRSADLANITFIEGETGIIIVDPCGSAEPAKVALDLYFQHRPKKPVVAVIYTHSHVDHFGGVRGVVSEDDIKNGRTKIIAPEGFTEEAVSENVMAGNAMARRASYMYGNVLPKGPQGSLGSGLGTSSSAGTVTLILPTDIIGETGQEMIIDGLQFEFLYAPGSEAPSELHFYIPVLRALCTAENACHTLHNFYTLRGAKTRDTKKWVRYLNQTLDMWGGKAEVLFAPHHWPVWGNAEIVDHIEKYRDTFKYIHDQALHMANQGYTMLEIAEMMRLPDELNKNWASRGYYGSVSHNAKAVYNFYLGFYSANPADLQPLPPVEAAKRYVEFMGGADAILAKAQAYFDQGEYRWVAQVVNHVVLADPENQIARNFQADALEQLGYQSESGPWRNFYLAGAKELREGIKKVTTPATSSADVAANMPLDMFLDYLAIRLNGQRAAGKVIRLNFVFKDTNQQYAVVVKNGVLNYSEKLIPMPDAGITLKRSDLNDVLIGQATLKDKIANGDIKVEGDQQKVEELLSLMDHFEFWFNIITANPQQQ